MQTVLHHFHMKSTYQDLLQEVLPTTKALKIDGFPNGWTIAVATQTECQLLSFREVNLEGGRQEIK